MTRRLYSRFAMPLWFEFYESPWWVSVLAGALLAAIAWVVHAPR